jgi:hypothetical protein
MSDHAVSTWLAAAGTTKGSSIHVTGADLSPCDVLSGPETMISHGLRTTSVWLFVVV